MRRHLAGARSFILAGVPTDAADQLGSAFDPSFTGRVVMPDGVGLATDVYLPVGSRGRRAPAVLVRTPYGRTGEIDAIPDLARLLNDHGIAVVGQDVRGKFDSSGAREPFVHELVDGSATVDWIAEQSWSDGAVVPVGASYAGFTAWAVAAARHSAVRGAVVRMTTCHVAEEWLYRQGLFRLQMNGPWASFAWGDQGLLADAPDLDVRPLNLAVDGEGAGHILRWLRNPPGSRWWDDHGLGSASPLSLRVRVPVLHWGGWWDVLARGQLREWRRLSEIAGAPSHRLVMGATDHDFHPFAEVSGRMSPRMPRTSRRAAIDADFEPAMDFLRAICQRDELKGARVRWELTHEGWHTGDSWPPATRHPVRLYLANGAHASHGPEGGALAHRPDTVPATVGWTHDPDDLVPSLESFVWGTLAHDYPDERDAQVRDDVVTFSGQPAIEPIDIVGSVRLRLVARASTHSTQLAATLCDVQPDGRALRLAEGARLVSDALEAQPIDIDLGPIAYRLCPGHRLRIAVSASSFPRYLWTPGDGLDPWTALSGQPSEQILQLGRASFLEISVLD